MPLPGMPMMTMEATEMGEPLCRVCKHPRSNHPFRHPFQGFDQDATLKLPDDAPSSDAGMIQGSPGNALRGDPVLRMALIRAGVITADQLTQVEAELKATGIAVT